MKKYTYRKQRALEKIRFFEENAAAFDKVKIYAVPGAEQTMDRHEEHPALFHLTYYQRVRVLLEGILIIVPPLMNG